MKKLQCFIFSLFVFVNLLYSQDPIHTTLKEEEEKKATMESIQVELDKANADLAKALEINPDNEMAKECLEKIIKRN